LFAGTVHLRGPSSQPEAQETATATKATRLGQLFGVKITATKAYIRRSTGKQKQSLRAQIIYVKRLANDLDLPPIRKAHFYIETKTGGDLEDRIMKEERPVFCKMEDELEPGDVVLFVHNDRMTRNQPLLVLRVREWSRKTVKGGKEVRVVFGNLQSLDVTSPEGEAMLGMSGIFSNWFLADLKRKTVAGLVAARQEGKRSGPVPPWFEEADEDGRRVLRPTKLAFDIEMACQVRNGVRGVARKYLPTVDRQYAQKKIRRFVRTMKQWRRPAKDGGAPWVRLRDEEREKIERVSDEESFQALEALMES